MMKSDLYTKSVLTVIAVALVYLCAERMMSPQAASAQAEQRVLITGYYDSIGIGAVRRLGPNGLPVGIAYPLTGQSGAAVRTSTKGE